MKYTNCTSKFTVKIWPESHNCSLLIVKVLWDRNKDSPPKKKDMNPRPYIYFELRTEIIPMLFVSFKLAVVTFWCFFICLLLLLLLLLLTFVSWLSENSNSTQLSYPPTSLWIWMARVTLPMVTSGQNCFGYFWGNNYKIWVTFNSNIWSHL